MKVSENDSVLIESAINALQNSYSPYSKFRVGAAVRSKSGNIFTGCNVENASYGLTICAERTALGNMVSEGETEVEAIAVVSDAGSIITPCGACRQFLREFANDDCRIICASGDDVEVYSLNELLPESFKPSDLK
ncbi:MAG: cytidine deaminase [candidate division Zixibacteria bacterium]|nr:cytidine deaminase [candidate division Zixibacteria bacterium]